MKRTVKTMHEEKHNILTRTHYITCLIALIIALALAGCGKNTPKAPPKQMVQDAVAVVLPPFLSLDSIELEPISTGPEAVKVNFKVIVAPKEDLYQVDREVEGTPKVTLLKVIQTAGAKASLYGSVEAHRMMDKWTLELPQIQVNPNQFGNPRGTFDAQSFVIGSSEASAALKEQAANAQLQEQARKAALEQRELEQKALLERLEEKKRQMEELSTKLDSEMANLKAEKTQLEQDLKNTEHAKAALDEKVQSLTAAALKFEQTVGGMESSLEKTRKDLDEARAEGIKLAKNLNEITTSLEEKMAQLSAVDAEKKRLLEEKAKLERQLTGKAGPTDTLEPVTVIPDSAKRVIETPVGAALQGLVTAVEGSLVTISIGNADGVEKGMIFHVIRNDSFVCDVKITEVDTEASAGTVQLVQQQQPKVGDIASTTW